MTKNDFKITGMTENSFIHHRDSTPEAHYDVLPSDEDWSQIEDKAKRRRVQNMAAQRRYRRKIRTYSSASDRQLEIMSISSRARASTNAESMLSKLDLSQLPSQQHQLGVAGRDRTPSLMWNSTSSSSSHHTSNSSFLKYGHQNRENTMISSPNNYISGEGPSPLDMPDKNLLLMEDSGQLHGLAKLNDTHPTPRKVLSSATNSTPLLSNGHKNRHAARLVNRIHNTLDELSMLYNIGIELELMQKDDHMSARLEALKRGFYNLARPST